MLKSVRKVVFGVSELYDTAEQQHQYWCIKPYFTAAQALVRCVINVLGQLYCLGLGRVLLKGN